MMMQQRLLLLSVGRLAAPDNGFPNGL